MYEETGGVVTELIFLGQYKVHDPIKTFIKSIFFAELSSMERKKDYLETSGPFLVDALPDVLDDTYSFIMRDEILPLSLIRLDEVGVHLTRKRDRM